ncbi:MAG: glucose/arabinose dehydrogenase [Planctomycetota bacterium]|jgi:glucose/arabinose dehydrogenase
MKLFPVLTTLFLLGWITRPALAQVSVQGEFVTSVPQRPTTLVPEPGDATRLYAANKLGRIYVIENGALNSSPFMDISALVNDAGENGLLGMALHPDFANNGFFYLSYTTGSGAGDSIISRFTVSATNPNQGDPASEQIVFGPLPQNTQGHKAGDLRFGPDGMLYYSLGDGWSGGANVDLRAQDTSDPRGSVLRFNVDVAFPHVPADNPFVGAPGTEELIWVQGLRNPWRIGMDELTGDLLVGDVGQSTWEELNWVPSSSLGPPLNQMNFGWPCKEGADCYGGAPAGCNCGELAFRDPAVAYDHSQGCSITAGTTYRGSAIPGLLGYHIYSDFCTGTIWAKRIVGGSVTASIDLSSQLGPFSSVVSITADADGELYITEHFSGNVTKIVPDCGASTYCQAANNSGGSFGKLAMIGSISVTTNNFSVRATDLPANQFAYFIASRTQGFVMGPGGSQGNLCLAGNIARFNTQLGQANGAGTFQRTLDLLSFPASPSVAVVAGDTWNFQCWHRDQNPNTTSNFSEGLSVQFCP